MTKLSILALALIIVSCNGFCQTAKRAGLSDFSDAKWIGDGLQLPATDSLYYLDDPSPLFRKEFKAEKTISSATLLITAAGYYSATMNGVRIGKSKLDPAWTAFGKRIYYSAYDVTALLQQGNNCLGVTLGNGFYNPLPLKMWGARNLRKELTVGRPVFIARILVKYKDGNTAEIVTNDQWKYSHGPILKNSVYLGEVFDARRAIPNWEKPGFDDTSWRRASSSDGPGGQLQNAFFPPVQITDKITPIAISSPESNAFIVDMGVNFTGTYRIRLTGHEGDTIVFRFGERIYENGKLNPMTTVCGQIKRKGVGGPGAPAIAWQTDSYVFGKDADIWYSPEFTFHTYRYMEISGLKKMPVLSDVEGLALHSAVAQNNSFSSSSQLLNSIQEATKRTFVSNIISVQSDCAAREKFGYGGDLNATSEAFIYNFDMQTFYRKTVYDWLDAMNDSVFVDTAPFVGIRYCGISWESAFLTTQYYLYLYYNDTNIIRELYDIDKKWMDKVARIHPEGIVNKGLSDHESLERVPVQLIGTGHYLQCARIMQQFAATMHDKANEEKYGQLAEKLKNLLRAEFWDKPVKGKINRQTLFASLLYYGIVPSGQIGAASDSLLVAVRNAPAGHFTTGIFGTKFILESLSQNVSANHVFDIVNNTSFPGWGFMMDHGATTIWETWKESDNTFSNCHPMFGSVSEWFYKYLGGISPDPDHPGFKKFILSPSTPPGLNFVNCTYQSPFGKIVSNWRRGGPGTCVYELTIPLNSMAQVILPVNKGQKVVIALKSDPRMVPAMANNLQSGHFELTGGEYEITISPDK